MNRAAFLKRMAFAAAACAFLDVRLPRVDPVALKYDVPDYVTDIEAIWRQVYPTMLESLRAPTTPMFTPR